MVFEQHFRYRYKLSEEDTLESRDSHSIDTNLCDNSRKNKTHIDLKSHSKTHSKTRSKTHSATFLKPHKKTVSKPKSRNSSFSSHFLKKSIFILTILTIKVLNGKPTNHEQCQPLNTLWNDYKLNSIPSSSLKSSSKLQKTRQNTPLKLTKPEPTSTQSSKTNSKATHKLSWAQSAGRIRKTLAAPRTQKTCF